MAQDILDTRLGEALLVVVTDTELRRNSTSTVYTLNKPGGERWVVVATRIDPVAPELKG